MLTEILQHETTDLRETNTHQAQSDFSEYSDLSIENFLKSKRENRAYKNYTSLKTLILLLLREMEETEKSVPERYDFSLNKKISLQDEVQRFEANLIRNALIHVMGSQTRAAQILGLSLSTLNGKMKRYGIDSWNLKKLIAEQILSLKEQNFSD